MDFVIPLFSSVGSYYGVWYSPPVFSLSLASTLLYLRVLFSYPGVYRRSLSFSGAPLCNQYVLYIISLRILTFPLARVYKQKLVGFPEKMLVGCGVKGRRAV